MSMKCLHQKNSVRNYALCMINSSNFEANHVWE